MTITNCEPSQKSTKRTATHLKNVLNYVIAIKKPRTDIVNNLKNP